MFIIFGWEKTLESLGVIGNGFCFHCRKTRAWIIGKETEWVSFYGIRAIPFRSIHHFVCEKCSDNIVLSGTEFRQVKRMMRDKGTVNESALHQTLMERIKTQQLTGKSELQLKWIQSSLEAEAEKRSRNDDAGN